MKIFIQTRYDPNGPPDWTEMVHGYDTDERAAPHYRLYRKALRMVVALRRAGTECAMFLVPESARDIALINAKGRVFAGMVGHFNAVPGSASKTKAIKRWASLTK